MKKYVIIISCLLIAAILLAQVRPPQVSRTGGSSSGGVALTSFDTSQFDTNGGTITIKDKIYGSGTVNRLTKWVGTNSLGDSIIVIDGNIFVPYGTIFYSSNSVSDSVIQIITSQSDNQGNDSIWLGDSSYPLILNGGTNQVFNLLTIDSDAHLDFTDGSNPAASTGNLRVFDGWKMLGVDSDGNNIPILDIDDFNSGGISFGDNNNNFDTYVYGNTIHFNDSNGVILDNANSGELLMTGDNNEFKNIPNGAEGTVLGISNGVPAYIIPSVGAETNPVQNFYSTSNYFNVAKGGKLIVTNGITPLDVAANSLLRVDSTQKVAAVIVGSGLNFDGTTLFPTNLVENQLLLADNTTGNASTTAHGFVKKLPNDATKYYDGTGNYSTPAGTASGASVWVPNVVLTYSSGTNVTIDGSGGTNFVLTVTNTTFFTTPSNLPSTTSTNTSFTVFFKMDATGGYSVTFTNTYFKFPGGIVFVPTTNANAVSVLSFTMSPFTAGQFYADYGILDVK